MIYRNRPVFLLGIILQHSKTWDMIDKGNVCSHECRGCILGYLGERCSSMCNTRCRGAFCLGDTCKEGCRIRWYGDECQNRCTECWNGCHQANGRCMSTGSQGVGERNSDYDHSSTKLSNKSGTALKACAAIFCFAVILFVVAACCRKHEWSVNVGGNTDIVEDEVGSDSSSSQLASGEGTARIAIHIHETEQETDRFEDFVMDTEPSAPILSVGETLTEQNQMPPSAPPPHPPPPQPVLICDPPPAYHSLFPDS